MSLYQTNLIIIYQKNNIKYYDPKKWSFYDQHFPYHLYKDEKGYQSLHKNKTKQGLEYFIKNRQLDCHNRIKKENELRAKLFKERLDRIRLGIHKELNPHHSSPEYPSRDSLKDPSRSKAIEIKKSSSSSRKSSNSTGFLHSDWSQMTKRV